MPELPSQDDPGRRVRRLPAVEAALRRPGGLRPGSGERGARGPVALQRLRLGCGLGRRDDFAWKGSGAKDYATFR